MIPFPLHDFPPGTPGRNRTKGTKSLGGVHPGRRDLRPRSLRQFDSQGPRRRKQCRNPNAAGQSVWVSAHDWGRVA
jgi:hypothetical protein